MIIWTADWDMNVYELSTKTDDELKSLIVASVTDKTVRNTRGHLALIGWNKTVSRLYGIIEPYTKEMDEFSRWFDTNWPLLCKIGSAQGIIEEYFRLKD